MSDKLGKDESIARVYQFLSNYGEKWKEDADAGKKDGVINQTEFRGFMLKNVNRWNGENKYDANDIITKFWKSIDTNTKGTMTRGYSNSSHLDNNEMENIQRNITISNVINKLFKIDGYKCPQGIDTKRWTTSMQASLLNKAASYTGSIEDEVELINFLKEAFKTSVAKTNADCLKDQILSEEITKIKAQNPDLKDLDYKYMSDSQLTNIIDTYISNLKGTETFQDIKDSIVCLIKDYLATANIGTGGTVTASSTAFDEPQIDENGQVVKDENGNAVVSRRGADTSSTDRLAQYNYENYGILNDLQIAVLSAKLKVAILKELANNNKKYTKYKTQADARIPSYITENVDPSKSFDELEKSIPNLASEFITKELAEIERIANDEALNKAKADAKTKVAGYNAKAEYKEAVKEVFGDDYNATIDACTTPEAVAKLVADLESKIAEIDKNAAEKAKLAGSYDALSSVASSISSDSSAISSIKSGRDNIHTEFGLDKNGNIVFEQRDTTAVYGALSYKVKSEFKLKSTTDEYSMLEGNLDRLIQAAWIMTYSKDYGSSESHNTEEFVKKVLTNLQLILKTVKEHPEYLSIYTGHTAYADDSITNDVAHYNKHDTWGNDNKIEHSLGYPKSDGSIHIENSTDDSDYQETMNDLLKNLKTKYAAVGNDDLIESVFRQAQMEALQIFDGNVNDCPYGTTWDVDAWYYYYGSSNSDRTFYATEHQDWSGISREDDHWRATLEAIVQQTLYCFDRLLYAKLAS